MKKTKFIALVLVVAIGLMGAGYAAWSDSILINTTVQTGQLDVHFVEDAEILLADPHVGIEVDYANDGSDSTDGQSDLDIANVTITNMYPKAEAKVTLRIQNNSTIPVNMNAITDTRSANWNANFEQIGASLRFFNAAGVALNEFTSNQGNVTSYANPWAFNQLVGAELPIGGYATLSFTFKAKSTISENDTFTFSPTAVFKQFE